VPVVDAARQLVGQVPPRTRRPRRAAPEARYLVGLVVVVPTIAFLPNPRFNPRNDTSGLAPVTCLKS